MGKAVSSVMDTITFGGYSSVTSALGLSGSQDKPYSSTEFLGSGMESVGIGNVNSTAASKKASQDAINKQNMALAELQSAQQTASSQAQAALSQKRAAAMSSNDIYTSPLGLTGQASVARKQLLGA